MSDDDKTIRLADKSDSAYHWTIEDMLKEALDPEKREPDFNPNKAVLIQVEFSPGKRGEDDYMEFNVMNVNCNDLEVNGILSMLQNFRAEKVHG